VSSFLCGSETQESKPRKFAKNLGRERGSYTPAARANVAGGVLRRWERKETFLWEPHIVRKVQGGLFGNLRRVALKSVGVPRKKSLQKKNTGRDFEEKRRIENLLGGSKRLLLDIPNGAEKLGEGNA